MLHLNIATPGRSIWDHVGRTTFESHVDAFSHTGFMSNSRVVQEEDWPREPNPGDFPFRIEKQLCDDFAFIAAFEYGVGYVTVTTIEPASSNIGSFLLRLTANEGVYARPKCAIEKLLSILERCARKGKSTLIMIWLSAIY